ncbi:ABC-2 type transport system permease protein [bacterium A37T11]|nr:ABC-2 type transport system permease protein [bacterium A37T11]
MNKIWLIIQREYSSRVKKKSFLLVTFLVPLFFIGAYALLFFLTKDSFENKHAQVQVLDESGFVRDGLRNNSNVTFINAIGTSEQAKNHISTAKKETYLLIVPKDVLNSQRIELYSSTKASFTIQEIISNQIEGIIRNQALKSAGIDINLLETIRPHVSISARELTAEGEKDSSTGAAMGIAISLSIIIYVALFLYGTQVMRGIIEEKTNRIIEVVISSVKPFQLMIGKIIGIGLVGLTQFALWIVLTLGLSSVTGTLMSPANDHKQGTEHVDQAGVSAKIMDAMKTVDFTRIIGYFLVFFIGGYMLYSALFAAVGSAVDNETETQQFTFPIIMPLLFTYILSFGVLINDPNGTLAIWLSMIPFTSPVAMLVRIPFGVSDWQILLSIVFLVAGFVFTTWVASRIYRVGILMYGKKASFKEIFKWFRYRS